MRRVVLTLCLFAFAFPGVAHAGEQTLVLHSYQPIAVGPYGVQQNTELIPSPPLDGYVVGISATVTDTNGVEEPLSHIMLHHIVFEKIGTFDSTCNTFTDYEGNKLPAFAQRFYAEGEERTQITMPPGYGYPNKGSDRWAMTYMLMNHRNITESVYVQYTIRYVTDESLIAVKPIWLDVRNCQSDPIFSVPGDGPMFSTYSQHSDFTLPEGGLLVAGGAHLHGGGLKLVLADRNSSSCSGRTLFESDPTWGLPVVQPVMHENGPKHMTTFSSAAGIPVAAGDTLRLTATYDDSLPHVRVMGIMLVFLAPQPEQPCAPLTPLPPDPDSHPGAPPRVTLPLLVQPSGPAKTVFSTFMGDFAYGAPRVTIKRGTTFSWTFAGPSRHDVTLASGPVGFASPSRAHGTFSFKFTRPGVYRLFCSLHPSQMTEIVTVR
ncbi:MAG: cupredoxin domain-containing protein [Gaiellaceae bacterium]